MDGVDVMEVEVYKKMEEHWKGDWKKEKRNQKEEHWEKRVNSITFYTNLVSSGELVERELDSHLFLNINLIFPSCCPRAKPSVVVRSFFLQILLIWAMVERHDPLL